MNIATNLTSLLAQSSLKTSSLKLNEAIERMSTGCKLNHSKDNAANYSIATSLTTKINSYQIAEDNVSHGLNLVSTASSHLDLISNALSRLQALAEQAANGTYGQDSLDAINSEANALVDEIQRVYKNTEYNGLSLFKNTSGGEFIQEVVRRDTSKMTTLASVDSNTRLTSGSYSISTAEELAKLAEMTNAGNIGVNAEFVLADNIDLSNYSSGEGWSTMIGTPGAYFEALFDGNGYTISNLYSRSKDTFGLFSGSGCTIQNLGVVDVNIIVEKDGVSALGGFGSTSVIRNCYSTGLVQGKNNTAGLACWALSSLVDSCYSSCTVRVFDSADTNAGGIVGDAHWSTLQNSYFTGAVDGARCVGGIAGVAESAMIENCYNYGNVRSSVNFAGGIAGKVSNATITNCYELSKSSLSGLIVGQIAEQTTTIKDCYYNEWYEDKNIPAVGTMSQTSTANIENLQSTAETMPFKANYKMPDADSSLLLQVGINSSDSSQLKVDTYFTLPDVNKLRLIGLTDTTCLEEVSNMLKTVSSKQTELGALENRLMSSLESISIQYENLVSSRSTIQDADIAEVSSEYIRQQILQQASATLMATANQTPAIALQLL